MNEICDAAVLGVGSSHGDDSIGWQVVDALSQHIWSGLYLRKLASPIEIIDCLDSATTVHVVDAAIGIDDDSPFGCFQYSDQSHRAEIESISTASTHGIGVWDSLRLADSLGYATDHLTIWFAQGESFESLADPSATAIESTRQCTKAILQELRNARSIAR
jgi:hydrogenase maturation protease